MLLYTKAHYTPKSRAEKLHTTDIKQDLMHLHRAPVTLEKCEQICIFILMLWNEIPSIALDYPKNDGTK